ncbi:putative actin-depolymerizing factor domain, ADF/Cofilin, ADF-H/Gelsolin-like domain superfamily [Helianthus anomalus]
MKWKKVHRYIVFEINEQSKLVTVDKVGAVGERSSDLTASLLDDDCRYIVFDFDFVTASHHRHQTSFFAFGGTATEIQSISGNYPLSVLLNHC